MAANELATANICAAVCWLLTTAYAQQLLATRLALTRLGCH